MEQAPGKGTIDWPTFAISGGFVTAFVVAALTDIDALTGHVNSAYSWSALLFGAYWQALLLVTFLLGLYLAASSAGHVRLGNRTTPESTTFKWFAVIMCTLLAGGGVFFAAAEPMAHFMASPPYFDETPLSAEAVYPALAQSYMHWGFLAWAILGSLTTLVFMHLHYHKGLPLQPRTLLYPIFGKRALKGWLGGGVDAACVIAVVAGTVGPIGFLGLQVAHGLEDLFGVPNTFAVQTTIIIGLICIYTISTVTGLQRGIQWLSSFNVVLALLLMTYLLLAGPTSFILDSYLQSTGLYLSSFLGMATYRADTAWLNGWTVFFWGWFIGYGPLMAMFIARISNGRSIRQIILSVSIAAPLVTTFWFTIVGGTGLAFELATPGSVSIPSAGFNMPATLLAITQQLPFGFLISLLFLILTSIFVATTGDSMTYTISMVISGSDDPPSSLRIFWGIIMGTMAIILITIGDGGISALQFFIVVTAVPVSFILLPSLWVAPRIARELANKELT